MRWIIIIMNRSVSDIELKRNWNSMEVRFMRIQWKIDQSDVITDIEFELKYSYIHQTHLYQCHGELIDYAKLILK